MNPRLRISAWVGREVVPHEPAVRRWLARTRVTPEDIDEVIQEAYCRLTTLESIDHIDRPDAYFFATCRNLLVRRLKRERLVPIATTAEIEELCADASLSPEHLTATRLDYARLMGILDRLPSRCREIVRLRKVEGWSHKEIAAHLDMSERAVEKQIWLGVRALREAWTAASSKAERRLIAFGSSKCDGR